jgi:head-tail adaptor
MQAGQMRNKVEIFTPSDTTNAFGEIELNFTSLGTYYCSLSTRITDEMTKDQALLSIVKYDLRFRYYSALENLPKGSYIVLGNQTLEVLAIANVKNLNKQVQIMCEERS